MSSPLSNGPGVLEAEEVSELNDLNPDFPWFFALVAGSMRRHKSELQLGLASYAWIEVTLSSWEADLAIAVEYEREPYLWRSIGFGARHRRVTTDDDHASAVQEGEMFNIARQWFPDLKRKDVELRKPRRWCECCQKVAPRGHKVPYRCKDCRLHWDKCSEGMSQYRRGVAFLRSFKVGLSGVGIHNGSI